MSQSFEFTSKSIINKDKKLLAKNYAVVDQLVKSANGVLYNGVDRRSGEKVIIKQIPRRVIRHYFNVDERMCPSEIYFHFQASKVTNLVVKPLDWFETRSSFVLVMEEFENGIDLFELSKLYGAIKEKSVKVIFHQIVECASKLHSAGIIHRDYKDENVLVNLQTLEVKIIDFGCATTTKSSYNEFSGTRQFFPPEWFAHSEYEPEPLTVWSLGCILYILLLAKWDFQDGTFQRDVSLERHLTEEARTLINSILCPNPNERANFKSVLDSVWFNNMV